MDNKHLVETIPGERKLLRKFKKYKTLSPDDPLIKKDDYYLKLLLKNDFVKISHRKYKKFDDGTTELISFKYSITETGLHYSQFVKEKIKNFLLRSILTPIIVSVITTLMTSKVIPIIWHIMQAK